MLGRVQQESTMNHLFQLAIASAVLLLTACHSKFGHPRENLTQTLLSEEVNMPRHYLFLIHGIGGDESHFGQMDLALTAALNAQSDTRHLVNSFEYETEHHNKSIYDFAQEFGA